MPETGIEPVTVFLEGRCSSQLSYSGKMVPGVGIEPTTLSLGPTRSSQLSYPGKFISSSSILYLSSKYFSVHAASPTLHPIPLTEHV